MDYSEDAENFFFNEENKKKRKKLKEKFGGEYYKNEDSELPPKIENEFLDYIIKFEEEWENAEEMEVYEYLGKPKFKKLTDIKEIDLPVEIEKVLDIYYSKNINIDVIEEEDVSEADFYKFLTEELIQHKFYPMPISGTTTHFIYEEFHPSDKLDAKDAIEDVLLDAFFSDREFTPTYLANENLLNQKGELVTQEQFLEELHSIFADVDELIEKDFAYNSFEFNDRNIVNVDFIFRYKRKNSSIEIDKIYNFTFELQRSEYGGMEVISYKLNT